MDNYILYTRDTKLDSAIGKKLRDILIPEWEKQNGRPFLQRLVIYERRLLERATKGRMSQEEANALIEKERAKLLVKRQKKDAVNVSREDIEKLLLEELESGVPFVINS